ncbi:MAG: hypothetical protein R3C68_15180 [Myxococcota bacterium]
MSSWSQVNESSIHVCCNNGKLPYKTISSPTVSQMLGLGWSGPLVQPGPNKHPIGTALHAPIVMQTVRSLQITAGEKPT